MGDVGEKMANEIQPTGEGAACRESGERTAPDRRVVRTRKAIRQAFLTLMQETEYQKITITGIAREADIDRKTFYLHYQSVEDLANEIVQDEADRIVRTCLDSLENSDDGENVVDLFKRLSLGLAPDLKSMKLIASQGLTARNTTVVGLSAALGVGVAQAGSALSQFPEEIAMILGKSPVVIATIMAVLLNLILPKETKE